MRHQDARRVGTDELVWMGPPRMPCGEAAQLLTNVCESGRAFSDDAATSIPVSHDDWQSTRSLRDILWPKAGEEQ